MKYIKIYEDKILDDILSKISDTGIDSLTKLENEYLLKYNKPEHDDIKKQLLNTNKKNISYIFDDIDDNELEYEINDDIKFSWYNIDDKIMNDFLLSYELNTDYGDYDWEDLPNDVKEYFQVFLFESDIINIENEETLYEMFWLNLDYINMDNFLSQYSLSSDIALIKWDNLNQNIKNDFIKYLKNNNMIV